MNTLFMLLAAHNGQALIPLQQVGEQYLGIADKAKLSQKARAGELPLPAFRMEKSQKAPWLVSIQDLAEYIDQQKATAKLDWSRAHG